jgi:hypothetical protein
LLLTLLVLLVLEVSHNLAEKCAIFMAQLLLLTHIGQQGSGL